MHPGNDAAQWDERYRSSRAVWSGDPNPQLVREVAALPPGRALDVGCGEGADAIWLAERGWDVVAADISGVALERAAEAARQAGDALARRIDWRPADFLTWVPEAGAFALVSAQFIHVAPSEREAFFRRLAEAVAPGGTLLVVGHHPSDVATTVRRPRGAGVLFTPADVVSVLGSGAWNVSVAEARPRDVRDAQDRPVMVHDTVVRAERLR